jgi:threonylcarbamoyladenosine tRNA methylthiotransferase MtaB
MYRASFETLGCRLNQTETALLADNFRSKGYSIVEWGEPADVMVVNTCSVTAESEARCRQVVRQALRRSPQAFVVVTGCYAQVGLEALRSIPGVDLVVGTEYKMKFPAFIGEPRKLKEPAVLHSALIEAGEFEVPGAGDFSTTRANLKIQDGCDFFCSFCIIPFTRGRERSRRMNDVLREARELASRGHQEAVLTGVNLGRYRSQGATLAELVRRLGQVEGLRRLRISSIEPTTIEWELVEDMAASDKLCPHLHIPIQSAHDDVLAAMNRRYTVGDYREFLERVLLAVPGLGLGTDVIVGHPGETDEAFEHTEALLDELPFSYFHVFSYSKRYGTRAARAGGQVPPDVVQERSHRLRALSALKRGRFAASHISQEVEVLFEQREANGFWTGRTANYLKVGVLSEVPLRNKLARVRVEAAGGEIALGSLV